MLINFFCLLDGRLLEMGTNLRSGAYSNRYGSSTVQNQIYPLTCLGLFGQVISTTLLKGHIVFFTE